MFNVRHVVVRVPGREIIPHITEVFHAVAQGKRLLLQEFISVVFLPGYVGGTTRFFVCYRSFFN